MLVLDPARQLQAQFADLVSEPREFRGEVSLTVHDSERIAEVCSFARKELGYDYLVDISSVDLYGENPRFRIVYHLYSYRHQGHLRLSTFVVEARPELPTTTGVWRGAEWHEREVFDLMGIRFQGHPDLRRILMWEGYPYYPLRKDFPMEGKASEVPEVAFSEMAPLEGGPFVTQPGGGDSAAREPRARQSPESIPAVVPVNVQEEGERGSFQRTQARADDPFDVEISAEVQGEKMILNMGPSHPATHGVLRLVLELDGEVITRATPHVGYLHRGDEKIAENMTYTQFIPYTDRLDYLAPLANNVAYALAVEKLLGIQDQLPPRCQYIRMICCELARVSSHLLGLGCFAMDTGAMTVFLYTFTEREKIYNLIEALTGARFTTTYTRIGGLARDLPDGWTDQLRRFLDEVMVTIDDVDKLLTRNRIFIDRTQGIGVLDRATAIDYGITGPNLRASGLEYDLRKQHPYLAYSDMRFEVPVGTAGDCYDRYLVRMEEIRQSVKILHQCLDRLPGGEINVSDGKIVLPPKEKVLTKMEELIHQFMLVTQGVNAPPGEIYFGAENPKGELGFYLYSKGGGTPYRLKIRAPSFVSVSLLPLLLPGHMISDVMAIIGSLDFVMGECDR
jgi:NADH-quinone oxidoreductase subunit D